MSKTFYANGNTGVVAIIEGEDTSIISNPYANADKIYFHSEFNYIFKVHEIDTFVNFPAIGGGGAYFGLYDLETIDWSTTATPIIFTIINGQDVSGDYLFYKDVTDFRLLGIRTIKSGGTLKISIYRHDLAIDNGIPSMAANIQILVYAFDTARDSNNTIKIQQNYCEFSQGKFKSNNKYAKQGTGFKKETSPHFRVYNPGNPYRTQFELITATFQEIDV